MSKIHVKYGLEFQSNLYRSSDRKDWLQAVGAELEKKGVSIKLGEGSQTFEIKNSAELQEFYARYESDPKATAEAIGLAPGRELKRYVSDLVQALDDIVKDTSSIQAGTSIDLSTSGQMSKMLGLDDASRRYASSRTEFGQTAPAQGAMSVLGVMLSRNEIEADPLEDVPHMTAATFDGARLKSGRRSQEYEAVRTLSGVGKDQLIELLRSERGGKTILRRMRKAKDAEAFSLGYSGISMDEMRWDSRAHKIREANPHISLTVESGRLEADDKSGVHEVSLGNDYFEDAYYDTKNFDLLDNEMSVRGRVRRDDPEVGAGAVRRVLIQSKIGSAVDENGVKFAAKADVRKDSPSEEDLETLDESVRSGISGWGYSDTPIEALGLVYKELEKADALATVGEHKGVLQLEKQAHVRSTRSRFHFNLTDRSAMYGLFNGAGEKNIQSAMELIQGSTSLDPADAKELLQKGEALLDKSAILERAKEGIAALDPNLSAQDITVDMLKSLWPSRHSSRDKMTALKKEVVANAISDAYHDFAELLDDKRSRIAGSRGRDMRSFEMTEDVMTFMREKFSNLKEKQTVRPFLEKFDQELAGPNKDAFIAELAKFTADEGNDALAGAAHQDSAIANIRKHLVSDHLEIVHRQIESAGSMSKALWFDDARTAFANASSSSYSNFLIDTFDVSEFYTPEQWEALTPEQRAGAVDIEGNKMFHATLVNEVQIELGYEKPYTDAVARAQSAIGDAKAGLFMDFALEQGLGGAVANQPSSFETFRQELLAMPEVQQKDFLAQFNAFAEAKGSPLQLNAEDLNGMVEAQFVTRFQNQDVNKHKMLLKDVEVNGFIWERLLSMQDSIADLRGRRVLREAERAGLNNVEWTDAELSKGDTAISMVKDGIQ